MNARLDLFGNQGGARFGTHIVSAGIGVLGSFTWRAMRRVGRALRDLNGELVQASECFWLAGRTPVPRSGPMACVPSLDGQRLTGSYLPDPGHPADASSRNKP